MRGLVDVMPPFRLLIAVVACSLPMVVMAPDAAAAPSYDGQGYVDSTARCVAPSTPVLFGSTATARIAICQSSGGGYTYRGVRVRDGARLIVAASSSGDGTFTAENDGIEYMVTPKSVVISSGSTVLREESWVDYHGPGASSAPAAPTSTAPPTPPVDPLPAEIGGSGTR